MLTNLFTTYLNDLDPLMCESSPDADYQGQETFPSSKRAFLCLFEKLDTNSKILPYEVG